jgi:sialate O-acetylesterase
MGGFPPNYFTAYAYRRIYPIPPGLLKKDGKNVIAVRVYDHEGPGGLVSDLPGIYDYKNYSSNSINLFGRWKFKLGDNASWSGMEIDDKQWEDILVPANWETQGFDDYDGFAWYRKTFKLPENYKTDDIMLLLGKIDDIDEVFVNGQLIGSTGNVSRRRFEHEDHQQYRTYTVPSNLLIAGKQNIIAVRVYDGTGGGGIYEGPITLLPRSEYRDFWREYKESKSDQSWWSYFLD